MESVFAYLKVTVADFPLRVTVVAFMKPLPRIVRVAPPAAETMDGCIVPMPNGTVASWTLIQ